MSVVKIERGDWCILRTQSANTLPLAKALSDAGFTAWTPTEVQTRRARRAIPRQDVTVALMPAIVFASYDDLADMIRLSRSAMPHQSWDAGARRMVMRGWPHFTILRIGDRYARVADRELAGLRRAESVRLTLAKKKTFVPGVAVRLMEGAGEGLRGTVKSVKGTFAEVRFPGFSLNWTVAFHLLEAVAAPALVA